MANLFSQLKKLSVYSVSRDVDFSMLYKECLSFVFTPCGSQDMARTGFISPFGASSEVMTLQGNGFILLAVKNEQKILPAPVIKQELEKKIAKLESEQSRKLKKTEKDSLKDEVLHSLLPRAFSKHHVSHIIIDGANKRIYINEGARKSEDLLALLRKTLGSLPVVPLTLETPAELTMTKWVKEADIPAGFALGDAAELKAILEDGGIARVKNQDLCSDEIITHLEAGKLVTRLSLDWQERVQFTLDDGFSLTGIKFSDALAEQNDDIDREDVTKRMDADFLLLTDEISSLVNALVEALGGEAKR